MNRIAIWLGLVALGWVAFGAFVWAIYQVCRTIKLIGLL